MMIDERLQKFLIEFFKQPNKIRVLIWHNVKDNNVQIIKWSDIHNFIKGPPELLDDVYELISNYNVDCECVCFTEINGAPHLMKIKKVEA